ncbi:MAG: plastocyanin/azurin family copper-binding protein, partial [Bdellovibrionota bacterium]
LGMLAAGLAAAAAEKPAATGSTITGQVSAMPSRYLSETVVYLKWAPGSFAPTKETIDQLKMQFVPHVLTITEGDTVAFTNHDPMLHNVFSPDNEKYDLGSIAQGEEKDYTFKQTGSYTQLCNYHPEMLGYVFVGQNPYMAVVDKNGQFKIDGVPPGNYEIAVWNSHLNGSDQSVSVTPEQPVNVNFSIHR